MGTTRFLADWFLPDFDCSGVQRELAGAVSSDLELDYAVAHEGGRVFLRFGDMACFAVDFAEHRIELAASAQMAAPASLHHLLYDHVIPRVLAATGVLVIHGSAVDIGGRLALFIGETGAGKSTLSASLHRKGHRLLGDDAVIITRTQEGLFGEAVYPSLRLFPESIAQLFGNDIATAPMAHYSDKRHVTHFSKQAATLGPLPLGQLFFLGGEYHEPCLEAIAPSTVCMALLEQSFALDPDDISAAARRMQQASQLAAAVPALALYYPHDYAVLGEVHRLIETTMEALAAPSSESSAS